MFLLLFGTIFAYCLIGIEIVIMISPFALYFYSVYGAILIPFGAMYSGLTGRYFSLFLSLIAATVSFGAFGGKGVFFSPLLALILTKMFPKNLSRLVVYLMYGVLILFALCIIETIIYGTYYLTLYVFRRMFYVPAYLSYLYFDYFSVNDYYYMSDSIFGSFFSSGEGQSLSKPRLIGQVYFGRDEVNANVNMWASAYGDFGYTGMLIVSAIAGGIASLFNIIYHNNGNVLIYVVKLSSLFQPF